MTTELQDVPQGPKPLDAPCPRCSAVVGQGCSSASGHGTRSHAPRWHAVGVANPSNEDRHREYLDGVRRKLDAISSRPPPSWWLESRVHTLPQPVKLVGVELGDLVHKSTRKP